MTVTTSPTTAANPAGAGTRLSRGPARIGAVALVVVLALVLWGVLFSAFGANHSVTGPLEPAIVDHFAGADGAVLGHGTHSADWNIDDGTWTLTNGTAQAQVSATLGSALATVEPGAGTVTVQAKLLGDGTGWGLAVRALGPGNLWYAGITTTGGPLQLYRVTGGHSVAVGAASSVHPATGSTVQLRTNPTEIEVRVDGKLVITVHSRVLGTVSAVGIVAHGRDASARWDDFRAEVVTPPVITVTTPGATG